MKRCTALLQMIIICFLLASFSGCSSQLRFETMDEKANEIALISMDDLDGVVAVQNYLTGELVCCVSVKNGVVTSQLSNFDNKDNNFL